MTLKIGKKLFGQDSLSEMKPVFEAVMDLPWPTVLPVNVAQEYKPGSQILARQGEFAHVSLLDTGGEVDEVGIRESSSCLGLYIFNDNDHCILHVDHTDRKFNLDTIIEKFESKENIRAMLLGGSVIDADERQRSERCLKNACTIMMTSSHPITLISQKIIENNEIRDESLELVFKDTICLKLAFLHQHFFDQTISQAWVKKLMSKNFQQYSPYSAETSETVYNALLKISILKDSNTESIVKHLMGIKPSKEQAFDTIVNAVFSNDVLKFAKKTLAANLKKGGKAPFTELRNYGINLSNQKIRSLTHLTPSVYEIQSTLRRPDTLAEKHYQEIYRINRYIEPEMGDLSKEAKQKVEHLASQKTVTANEISDTKNQVARNNFPNLINEVYAIKCSNSKLALPIWIHFYKLPKKSNNQAPSEKTMETLIQLKQTERTFEARQRAGRNNITDAVSGILTSYRSLKTLRRLGNQNIPAEIRTDEKGELRVCVFNIGKLKL